MKTQLVIMAAGIGSRFGEGIKQLTPLGPNGEVIMEYSVHAAKAAGFSEVVIILRKEILDDFKKIIGNKLEKLLPCRYAFQELTMLPGGFTAPADRKKPYGTAHAIYCAKSEIDSPFLVINADDYYGTEGFKVLRDHLEKQEMNKPGSCPACDHRYRMCMAGYVIGNTLSENGTVTRGLCHKDKDDFLTDVVETYEIKKHPDGKIIGEDDDKKPVYIDKEQLVSMNMFGFPYEFLDELEGRFIEFLKANNTNIKSEFLLPKVVNEVIKEGKGTVHVYPVKDRWYGVTYATDKEYVREALKNIKL